MSLKFRLAFLFSISVFVILLVSAISISLLNENFRREEFNKRVTSEALETNQIFTKQADLSRSVVDALNENTLHSLPEEQIVILNGSYKPIYVSPDSKIPLLAFDNYKQAARKGQFYFRDEKRQGFILYSDKYEPHYVICSAFDFYGYRKSANLRLLLMASIIGGLLLSGLVSFFYVTQALKPLENLTDQIERMTDANLEERIEVKGNNEVAQLGKQFNAMLERLDQAFDQRKNFVQHASHELRTPLANMLSQTEVALAQDLTKEEFRKILYSLKEDQEDLIDLINSLLTLSRYEKLPIVHDQVPVRIDEVLFDTTDFVLQVWPDANISIDFDNMPDDEQMLVVNGNESLIKSAIQNLVKNGVQYSNNQKVRILISVNEKGVRLSFENEGKQLTVDEQGKLFIPFFRGENSTQKKGYGLGLSIVERIINLHKGNISYQALGESINRFTVYLPT